MGAGLALAAPGAALADRPFRLDNEVTDKVGALGSRQGEVSSALQQLRTTTQLQLFVVYVKSFDKQSATEWANETARISGLGQRDGLLAVATKDRAYGYSFDNSAPLSDSQLAQVSQIAIEPALAKNDWAGAAIGAADGYKSALTGAPITAPKIQPGKANPGQSTSLGGSAALLFGLLMLGLLGGALWLLFRNRRRSPRASIQEPVLVPVAELSLQASVQLVASDDALKTSEQELGFATAQYGAAATEGFKAALQQSQADVAAAFRIRQELDDAFPEPEEQQRGMLAEIMRLCTAANQRLDQQAAEFDALRELESRVDQAMPVVAQRRGAVAARLPGAEQLMTRLSQQYAEAPLQPVVDNLAYANDRLEFVDQTLSEASASLGSGDRSAAAVAVRGAEEGVAQAGMLIDAVENTAQGLDSARATIEAELAEMDADLAAGRAAIEAGGQDAAANTALASELARSEQITGWARAQVAAARPDPIAILRRLKEADDALDRALGAVRDAAQRSEKARRLLDQTLASARAEIAATNDYITTRRGGIGSEARTRLAEAQRYLELALQLQASDAPSALSYAQQAQSLASQATQAANRDLEGWARPMSSGPTVVVGGGGFGGMGGAVLGGILLDSILGGGRGGGGMFGGRVPGSFGGSGTRARHGGGGRF